MKSLSIVIPAYNELDNFNSGCLNQIADYLKQQKLNWQVIIVDDGSTDGSNKKIKAYAKKHGLVCNRRYLYAYRDHDKFGAGIFNKTIHYKKGVYYRDWHLDMRPEIKNSFGLGIFPKGNTKVRVKISDWGVAVEKDGNRDKARVWGFEII